MKLSEVKMVLGPILKQNLTPLLIGHHGIGKSEGVKQYAEANGLELIDVRLGQMGDAGDLLGLAEFVRNTKGEATASKFMPPSWLPRSGKGILFLDEVNRARRDLLQAIFQLILDKRINEYQLPEGWHVVAAANPPGDEYTVTDMSDPALASRFVQLYVKPSAADFIEYGQNINLNPALLGFLGEHPEFLHKGKEVDIHSNLKPSSRGWKAVAQLMGKLPENLELEVFAGIIGYTAATTFLAYKKDFVARLDAKTILTKKTDISDYVTKGAYAALSTAIESLVEHGKQLDKFTSKQADCLYYFIDQLPADLGFTALDSITRNCPTIFNSEYGLHQDQRWVVLAKKIRKSKKAA